MYRFSVVLISWVILVSVINGDEFPSDIQRCKYSDSDCLSSVVTNIINTHYKGHRHLNLIPIDPLHIKSLHLKKIPDSPVNVDFKFKDVDLTGISNGKITKVTGFTKEPSDLVFEIHGTLEELKLNGPYSVSGRVLILPITGEGNSEIIFKNIDVGAKVKCTTVEKDGKIYLNIAQINLDLKPKSLFFNLENLFGGNKPELSNNMNKFLNENWKEIYGELEPLIDEAISKILLHIANAVFGKYSYKELFLA